MLLQLPILIAMFGFTVPNTVKNFVDICLSQHKLGDVLLSYNNSIFHRIIPNFMIQGGDFTNANGTGGLSIFGEKFPDENFEVLFDVGVIAMANSGPHTNGSQFFITTAPTSFLYGKHVVFGIVTYGMDVVYKIEAQGSEEGTPRCPVKIVNCELLK